MSPLRLSVVAALLAGAAYALALGTPFGRRFDRSVLQQTSDPAELLLNGPMIIVINPLTVSLAGLVAIGLVFRDSGGRAAAGIGLALAGTVLGAYGLKSALGALDPLDGEQRRVLGSGFFPSGHAGIVMTFGLIAIRAAAPERRRRVALVAGLGAGALGTLIFAGDNHHPSDVLGGVLLASAWTTALVAWPPGIAVARGPCGRAAAVRPAGISPVIAMAAVVAAVAVLIWRPLLLATIVLVTLTTVGLALAFERSLAHGRLPLRR